MELTDGKGAAYAANDQAGNWVYLLTGRLLRLDLVADDVWLA